MSNPQIPFPDPKCLKLAENEFSSAFATADAARELFWLNIKLSQYAHEVENRELPLKALTAKQVAVLHNPTKCINSSACAADARLASEEENWLVWEDSILICPVCAGEHKIAST